MGAERVGKWVEDHNTVAATHPSGHCSSCWLAPPVLIARDRRQTTFACPITFSQKRIGRDGSNFGCLKIRSMRPDALWITTGQRS